MFIKAQVYMPVHVFCKRHGETVFTLQMAIDTRGYSHFILLCHS